MLMFYKCIFIFGVPVCLEGREWQQVTKPPCKFSNGSTGEPPSPVAGPWFKHLFGMVVWEGCSANPNSGLGSSDRVELPAPPR